MATAVCFFFAVFGVIPLAGRFSLYTVPLYAWFLCAVTAVNFLFLMSPRRGTTPLRPYFEFWEKWRVLVVLSNVAALPATVLWGWKDPVMIVFLSLPYMAILSLALNSPWVYRDIRDEVLQSYKRELKDGEEVDIHEIDLRTKVSLTREWLTLADDFSAKTVGSDSALVFAMGVMGLYSLFSEDKFASQFAWPLIIMTTAIISAGVWMRSRSVNLLIQIILEHFGVADAEVRKILRRSLQSSRYFGLQNALLDYGRRHSREIEASEKVYEHILTNHGFLPIFVMETKWVKLGNYRVSNAIFWHRNGLSAEQAAIDIIARCDTPANRKNPEIFLQNFEVMKNKNQQSA